MSTNPPIRCEQFDEGAEDLALGLLDEPHRSMLLAHAADCSMCQSLLDGLGTVVDRLLLVAPQVEPPAAFEIRALARIGTASVTPRQRFRLPLWAAAVAALIVGAGGFVTARLLDSSSSPSAAPTAVILTSAGLELGSVQLLADPAPHVLITIPTPRPDPGVRNCELQRPDGTWVHVGSWQVADIAHGTWATGIDTTLLDAAAMRITTQDGRVLATATFT